MTGSPGLRFEATQALRQVLHRAVVWGMIDINPAKVGVDNPTRRRKEQHPFESWDELETIAVALGPRYGPMMISAARSCDEREHHTASTAVLCFPRNAPSVVISPYQKGGKYACLQGKPSDGLEPSTPSLPWRCSTN
jgi:hypothetical protein